MRIRQKSAKLALSVDEQLQCVQQDWRKIRDFPDAPEEVQIAALAVTTEALPWIKHPTEHAQRYAVSQDGTAIEHIRSPSSAVQRAALLQNVWAIRYIPEPDDELQLLAVRQNPEVIFLIARPCVAAQRLVALSGSTAIRLLKDPPESVQIDAIRAFPWTAFEHIDNPSRAACLEAVRLGGRNIRFVSEPDEEMQLLATLQSPTFLQLVPSPSPRIVEALKVLAAMDVRPGSNDFKTLLRDMIQPQTVQTAPTHA